jgi:hypothetical protein
MTLLQSRLRQAADAATWDQGAWRLFNPISHYGQPWDYFSTTNMAECCKCYLSLSWDFFTISVIIVLTASFSALSVLFTWAFGAGWECPDSCRAPGLSHYSRMRFSGQFSYAGGFTITLVVAFYGLVRFGKTARQDRLGAALKLTRRSRRITALLLGDATGFGSG